ncbi:hypothetical protein Y032_0581g271 [Ancylostoma ceylanicum]|nr:hypothetical protein Y032_0581g271 [Ancylostoma ceylanicum]
MQHIIFLLATVVCCLAVREQAVGVTGRLMCGNKPAVGVKVKLWEEDDGPDPDDLLDQGFTDSNGNFNLKVGVPHINKREDNLTGVHHRVGKGSRSGYSDWRTRAAHHARLFQLERRHSHNT